MEVMGWDDLNWLEDVHMGYEEGQPAIFDRNVNGWVRIPPKMKLPDNQQDRDMLARELLIEFQIRRSTRCASSTRPIGSSECPVCAKGRAPRSCADLQGARSRLGLHSHPAETRAPRPRPAAPD